MSNWGIVYIGRGQRWLQEARTSAKSAEQHKIPYRIITDDVVDGTTLAPLPIHPGKHKHFIVKTVAYELSPFSVTAYLDSDTWINKPLDWGFEQTEKFGLSVAYERPCIYKGEPYFNAGVIFFKKDKAIAELFSEWRARLDKREDGHDQPPLSEAIAACGIRPFILPPTWNTKSFPVAQEHIIYLHHDRKVNLDKGDLP